MASELRALGARIAATDAARAPAAERLALEQGMRASLLCTLLGVEREQWVWDFAVRARQGNARARMLAGVFQPLGGIGHLATLAGASDLDPMDPGPSHTVLPATLAACIAAALDDPAPEAAEADRRIANGVLAGVEAAWRMRRAVTGTRPGVGFHSPGVFGTIAAAAAAARTLALDELQCSNAVAIALTRAGGLGINSAASMIGMTHFGWGAAHGLEAALLAAEGWDASHDVERALASLFGQAQIDVAALDDSAAPAAVAGLVFKRYPCNIYLNLLVSMLDAVQDKPVDRIEVRMPWIPHLDCPHPRDLRQARNSAQAVAAIAGTGDASYAAFSGPSGPWQPAPEVSRLLANVELVADRTAPTRLNEAVLGVRAWRGAALVQDAQGAVRELGGWGIEHARRLLGPQGAGSADALYGGTVLAGFAHVNERLRATARGVGASTWKQ